MVRSWSAYDSNHGSARLVRTVAVRRVREPAGVDRDLIQEMHPDARHHGHVRGHHDGVHAQVTHQVTRPRCTEQFEGAVEAGAETCPLWAGLARATFRGSTQSNKLARNNKSRRAPKHYAAPLNGSECAQASFYDVGRGSREPDRRCRPCASPASPDLTFDDWPLSDRRRCTELQAVGLGTILRRRCFRVLRSSSGVDGSISLSICWVANSRALDAASRFLRRNGCCAVSPSSRSRRIASEREVTPFSSAHFRFTPLPSLPNVEFASSHLLSPGSGGTPKAVQLTPSEQEIASSEIGFQCQVAMRNF